MGTKGPKWGLFGVLSFMKITLVSPSLDQKEQNCFGHPQFYSSIAPMFSFTHPIFRISVKIDHGVSLVLKRSMYLGNRKMEPSYQSSKFNPTELNIFFNFRTSWTFPNLTLLVPNLIFWTYRWDLNLPTIGLIWTYEWNLNKHGFIWRSNLFR